MNLQYHKLIPSEEMIEKAIADPSLIGLSEEDFTDMNAAQRRLKIIGEYYFMIWKELGFQAGEMLMMSHWGGEIKPNWFDHRLHLLQPHNYVDYWTVSSDQVLRALPLNGKLLSLCCGDGFYEGIFYSKRASEVLAIDIDGRAIANAKRVYPFPNITWIRGDLFDLTLPDDYFDVVTIRGAIEHFTLEQQLQIARIARRCLRSGGVFTGDTPANSGEKMHTDHENEWKDEEQMRNVLGQVFSDISTTSYHSKDRTTLLWNCQK